MEDLGPPRAPAGVRETLPCQDASREGSAPRVGHRVVDGCVCAHVPSTVDRSGLGVLLSKAGVPLA